MAARTNSSIISDQAKAPSAGITTQRDVPGWLSESPREVVMSRGKNNQSKDAVGSGKGKTQGTAWQ